jgi:hypothetical protein
MKRILSLMFLAAAICTLASASTIVYCTPIAVAGSNILVAGNDAEALNGYTTGNNGTMIPGVFSCPAISPGTGQQVLDATLLGYVDWTGANPAGESKVTFNIQPASPSPFGTLVTTAFVDDSGTYTSGNSSPHSPFGVGAAVNSPVASTPSFFVGLSDVLNLGTVGSASTTLFLMYDTGPTGNVPEIEVL